LLVPLRLCVNPHSTLNSAPLRGIIFFFCLFPLCLFVNPHSTFNSATLRGIIFLLFLFAFPCDQLNLKSQQAYRMNQHTHKMQELTQQLKANAEKGLPENEALSRLKQYGPNQVEQKPGKSLLRMFAEQLNNALIYVLFAAVIVTVMLQEYIDAVIILVVI